MGSEMCIRDRSWELNKLYFNNQNLKIEYEILKEENLKLLTQFHLENLPSGIEKQAKENLGMIKKEAKEIYIDISNEEE